MKHMQDGTMPTTMPANAKMPTASELKEKAKMIRKVECPNISDDIFSLPFLFRKRKKSPPPPPPPDLVAGFSNVPLLPPNHKEPQYIATIESNVCENDRCRDFDLCGPNGEGRRDFFLF